MSEKINWINEKRKVVDLMPADYNPRKINEAKKDELLKSLEKLGMIMPIIINRDNKIIGGHQRIALMRDLNIEEVDVRVPDRQLTEQEEKEANLTTNTNNGEWDFSKLVDNFDYEMILDFDFNKLKIDNILFDKEDDDNLDDNGSRKMIYIKLSMPEKIYLEISAKIEEISNIDKVKFRKSSRRYKK